MVVIRLGEIPVRAAISSSVSRVLGLHAWNVPPACESRHLPKSNTGCGVEVVAEALTGRLLRSGFKTVAALVRVWSNLKRIRVLANAATMKTGSELISKSVYNTAIAASHTWSMFRSVRPATLTRPLPTT